MKRTMLALLLMACGSNPTEPPPLPESTLALAVVAGDAQAQTVGTELSTPIVVKVTKVVNAPTAAVVEEPVPGQIVNWVVVSGGGHVFAGSGITDSLGQVKERWTLGTTAGTQVLEARAVDATTGEPIVFDRVDATALPGPVVDIVMGKLDTLQVGDTLRLRDHIVVARDQYGNTATDYPLGYTLWRGNEPGDPVEVVGDLIPLTEPFVGTVILWSAGVRTGGDQSLVVVP